MRTIKPTTLHDIVRQGPYFGAFTVCVEPLFRISGVVSAHPELQGGFDTTHWFYYSLFIHSNTCGHSIPPGIIGDLLNGNLCVLLVHTVIRIYPNAHLSTVAMILTETFYLGLSYTAADIDTDYSSSDSDTMDFFLGLKYFDQDSNLYWGTPPKNSNELSGIEYANLCLEWYFDCSGIFLILHCCVYYKNKSLVPLMVSLS